MKRFYLYVLRLQPVVHSLSLPNLYIVCPSILQKSAHRHNGATRHTPVGFLPLSRFSRPSNGLFHRNLLVLNQDYRQFLSIWIYLPRQYKRDSSPVEYHHIARIALYWKHFFRYFPYLSSSCNSSVNKYPLSARSSFR